MKIIFSFLLLFIGTQVKSQNFEWTKTRIVAGSAWSMDKGDEYLYFGLQIPLSNKIHTGINYGYRPQELITHQIGLTIGYDLYTNGPHRLYAKSDLSFFYRSAGLIWDDRYWRQSFGLGYITQLYKRVLLLAEYSVVGFYYGTRNDRNQHPSHPSILMAGEVKLGAGYRF